MEFNYEYKPGPYGMSTGDLIDWQQKLIVHKLTPGDRLFIDCIVEATKKGIPIIDRSSINQKVIQIGVDKFIKDTF